MNAGGDTYFDVSFERVVPVPAAHLWRGWTDAAVLKRWFTPAPWVTTDAEVDPRPGGIFRTVMRGPDGEVGGGIGCVLEAIPNERFVWTSALGPGFQPQPQPTEGFHFTGMIELEQRGSSTLYRATGRHSSREDADAHAAMGFEVGWGMALDQLVALHSPTAPQSS